MEANGDVLVGLTAGDVDAVLVGDLARELGVWTPALHRRVLTRRPLAADLSTAADLDLSNELLYWASELGRLTELTGAVSAQIEMVSLEVRVARAAARDAARQTGPSTRPPSQAALDDAADLDPSVAAATRRLTQLRALAAHVGAAKEATAGYVAALSREITLRGDSKRARI